MRASLYAEFLRNLEAADSNGYDLVYDMEPPEVLEDLYETLGEPYMRQFAEVPEDELLRVIRAWQIRNEQ